VIVGMGYSPFQFKFSGLGPPEQALQWSSPACQIPKSKDRTTYQGYDILRQLGHLLALETRGFPSLSLGRFGFVGDFPIFGLTISPFLDPSSHLPITFIVGLNRSEIL
jgi:hypothetical protein